MTHPIALALSVCLVAGALLTLIWVFQRALIYFPLDPVPAPAEVHLGDAEPVTFPTEDGLTLQGWFLPVARTPPPPTVLVFNGNAGNRAYRAPLAAWLHRDRFQVLLFDYRGYGGNDGSPTEAGLAADARAARAYLEGRRDVDDTRLFYFGESLGSAVATALAAERAPAGLILRSPFPSLADVGRLHYPLLPVRALLKDRFAAIEQIKRVRCPVLVLAGDRDRIVPLELSRRLYEAALGPKELVIVPGADHNDLALVTGDTLRDAVGRFLQTGA